MRVIVTGAGGFVGGHLVCDLARSGFEVVAVVGRDRSERVLAQEVRAGAKRVVSCDLREGDAVRRLFEEEEFDGVIHCAALSRGRECEADPEGAFTANVEVPRGIVAALQGLGREPELLSLSTDLVFEGRVAPRGGFSEEDDTAPVTVYAKTKRLGEEAVLGYARGSVFRLSLVYGARIGASAGFLEWIFCGVESGRSVPLFTDEYRTPVCVHDISEVCRLLLRHPAPLRGVFHVGGSERLSRYEFGVKLASVFGFEERLLLPVSRLSGLGDGGFRAEDVSLSVERLRSVLGFVPCDVLTGLGRIRG